MRKKELTRGDTVWAYAYELNRAGTGYLYKQVPIQGMLSGVPYPSDPDYIPAKENLRPKYFIPFAKNSTDKLAWGKCVKYESRQYAATEEEATLYYNALIQAYIDELHNREQMCLADMLPEKEAI